MTKHLVHLLASFLGNAVGIFVASRIVSGFVVSGAWVEMGLIALFLTLLGMVVRPLLKLILFPLILLTLGLALLAINGVVLYILDTFVESLTIETIPALIYATLIITATNIVSRAVIRHR